MDRLQLGEGLARSLAWGLAAMATCCGQVSERGKPQGTAAEAGQNPSSASGGSANLGGAGGAGLAFGGVPVADDQGGTTNIAGAAPFAVPLRDTMLCGHDFVRVDQLPDVAPFFSGTFDGEPVDVTESVDDSEEPPFYVLRFGATQVEAISFGFYLAEGPYQGFFQVNAADCGTDGRLLLGEAQGFHYYELDSAELVTVTQSVDGFTGLTMGSVSASWSDDDGEHHALAADFVLTAIMGDASIRR